MKSLLRSIVLGIETSCDDTCIALIDGARKKIIGNVRYTQHHIHQASLGIVPFAAQKQHLLTIPTAFDQLVKEAGIEVNAENVDLIAVTNGPGLALSLLVGLNFAKELSTRTQIPIVGVHHMAGHALIARMLCHDLPFPYMSLLLSGGHSLMLKVNSWNDFSLLGTSVDDSIGEALDKGCRTLSVPWDLNLGPGSALERIAGAGDPSKYAFTLPFSKLDSRSNYNTSFAGLKTALKIHAQKEQTANGGVLSLEAQQNLAASYQNACFSHVIKRLEKYYKQFPSDRDYPLVVSGGVASNAQLREMLQQKASRVVFPPPALCTDNAVMIAWAAFERMTAVGEREDLFDCPHALDIRPRWPLSELNKQRLDTV